MNGYENFVIYKIYHPDSPDIFYIGSTKKFGSRKSNHKKNCVNRVSKKYHYPLYKYIRELGGWDNFKIEIYLKYPCKTKMEGLLKEQEVIDLLQPKINQIMAIGKK